MLKHILGLVLKNMHSAIYSFRKRGSLGFYIWSI